MGSTLNYQSRRRKPYAGILIAVLVALATGCSTPASEAAASGYGLDSGTLKQFDLRLFNELGTRTSALPKDGYTYERRVRMLRDMATKGFEPAGLALLLFDFPRSGINTRKLNRSAFKRLLELADGEDPSAMCLAARVIWHRKIHSLKKERIEFIKKASDKGHPRCLGEMAAQLKLRNGTFKRDLDRSDNFRREAAREGDEFAIRLLFNGYAAGYGGYKKNAAIALCWFRLGILAETGETLRESFYFRIAIRKLLTEPGKTKEFAFDPKSKCSKSTSLTAGEAFRKWVPQPKPITREELINGTI